jgi:hypothetical protein
MTQLYDEHAAMTPDQRRALAGTASGPHNRDADDEQFKHAMAYHGADSERMRRQEIVDEAKAIAATAGSGLAHFATGRALDRFTNTKVRRMEDPPDAQHSSELADNDPVNVGVLALHDVYGLNEDGLSLPEDQITEAQRQARANRYRGNDPIEYDEER